MDEIAKPQIVPRRRRWWKRAAAVLVLLIVGLVAFLPALLGTEAARIWLLERANRALSPGRLEVQRFHFSWLRGTRLDGFALRDPQGEKVVDCARAVWDRNLFQILFQRPRFGTLHLDGAIVDIERAEDGSIDIVEALRPILNGSPPTDWTILVENGSLRLRSPEAASPIEAKSFRLVLRRPAAPGAITWDATLAKDNGNTLGLTGEFDRWDDHAPGHNDMTVGFRAENWPLRFAGGSLNLGANLDGRFGVTRTNGLWSSEGNARLKEFVLSGAGLSGDTVRLAEIGGRWSVGKTDLGWEIASLDVRSPIGTLKAIVPKASKVDQTNQILGSLDLAAISSHLPMTLRLKPGFTLDRGSAELAIDGKPQLDRRTWTARAHITDLAAHLGETNIVLHEPARLSATILEGEGSITVESFTIESAFLRAEGSGELDSGVKLKGTIDLDALARQAADFLDLGKWTPSGTGELTADLKRDTGGYVGRIESTFAKASFGPDRDALLVEDLRVRGGGRTVEGFRLQEANLEIHVGSAKRAGLTLGSTDVLGHRDGDAFVFEPIETTLNGGRLRLVPELITQPDLMLKLGTGSVLVNAEVNEEATRRVLAFVAPILEGTTRAKGRVSAKIERAEFPLGADARRKAIVEGNVVFQDVEFAPGPLASVVLEMIGRSDATLRLDQPVVLSISEGMVHQRGLAVPVGNLTRIEIEGSVGFDRSLDVRATLPLTSAMFPNNAAIGNVVGGSRITVPIGGTLDRPKVDRDAFRASLAEMGKGMLLRSASRGASDLLFRLARPRDPNAPPPPTPEERKAKR